MQITLNCEMNPTGFAERLAQTNFPGRLGDVALRYEASLFVGETTRRNPVETSITLAWVAFGFFLVTLVSFLVGWPVAVCVLLVLATALCAFAQTVVARRSRQQRRFVLNFETMTLRLDIPTPWLALSKTVQVGFDDVSAVHDMAVSHASTALTVDVKLPQSGATVLRELLIADISPAEHEAKQKVKAFLERALGVAPGP